jgi:RNA polymerase sigma-70 factor, ECF subfamily
MHNRLQKLSLPAASAPDHAPTDEELLTRMDTDRTALGLLYGRYAAVLLGIGVAVLRSEAEAEDAVHDVFVRLTARARQYDPRFGSARAWLSAAMRNACIDLYRRRAYRRRVGDEVKTALSPQNGQDASTVVRALDGHRAIRAVAGLSKAQKRTIESLYCEDMSCTEVARRDRVPVGTVKSRAARAIMVLRSDLLGRDETSGNTSEASSVEAA